jgi:thiamine biosynthesis lipoprotein
MAALAKSLHSRASAAPATHESVGFAFDAMSSACEIRLAGDDSQALADAAALAMAEVRRIEQKYSRYRDDSVVSAINAAAGTGQAVEVDAETASLLDFAATLHAASDGAFDITSGVLRRVWDFRAGRMPDDEALGRVLPLIGWSQVSWHARRIRLPRSGMEIDFGGFGKEYAADRAMAVLVNEGQCHGFVNLGGDIRVLGPRRDGAGWQFGIRHPRRQGTIASITLAEGALATSGDYERHFERDGRRYCHILDPRTGWPVQAWSSVSVVAPACVAAGALSTIAMLSGPRTIAVLESECAGYLAIDSGLGVHPHAIAGAPRFVVGEQS